jgi:electron transport complex protein RnfC
MVITHLKSKETIESLAKGKTVIINCHGCKEVYFPEHEADELQKELSASKEVTQIINNGLYLFLII